MSYQKIVPLVLGIALFYPASSSAPADVMPNPVALSVFVAHPPYDVAVNGKLQRVNLGGLARDFDLSRNGSFDSSRNAAASVATMNFWDGHPRVLSGRQINEDGAPGRIERDEEGVLLGYRAGDGPVAGACRTQISSFPVPSNKKFVWDLMVQFGIDRLGMEWFYSPPGSNPVLFWQLKAPGHQPSLALVVDTARSPDSSLSISFSRRENASNRVIKVGNWDGLPRHDWITIVMEAYLDERPIDAGGKGYWRVWINGMLALDTVGPTLSRDAQLPHQWFLSNYLYKDECPSVFNRYSLWKRARMLESN